jgi:hypothetical protein
MCSETIMGEAGPEHRYRAEWDKLCTENDAAYAKVNFTEDEEALAKDAHAATPRLHACARRIWNEPVRSFGDIKLLADVCYRALWTNGDLDAPDADARLAGGPDHDNDRYLR